MPPSTLGSYPLTCHVFHQPLPLILPSVVVCAYSALGVDVANIRADTRGALDVVQRKLTHARVELEEERQRLANPATGTENSDLGCLDHVMLLVVVSSCDPSPMAGIADALTLAAVAEKALRWAAAPRTERVAVRAANIVLCDVC